MHSTHFIAKESITNPSTELWGNAQGSDGAMTVAQLNSRIKANAGAAEASVQLASPTSTVASSRSEASPVMPSSTQVGLH